MGLLTSILNDESQRHPLLVLQSSLAQSSLPVFRHILAPKSTAKKADRKNLLFCFLYPPSCLLDAHSSDLTEIYDWTDRIPGYNDVDSRSEILAIVEKAVNDPSPPLNVMIDSVDTFLEDINSVSETYKCLSKLYALVKTRPEMRLVLHSQSPSALLPLVTQTAFSASLTHVIAHQPSLIAHLATEFLMPPPPNSPETKFWSVFLPVSERISDTEQLVFGSSGEGCGNPSEFVVELLVREGQGRKRGVERVLEGYLTVSDSPCELSELESLKHLTAKEKEAQPSAPDPTQNLSFNLNLTASQQASRAQVPLPYAHEGTPITSNIPAAIFYDPDSADDIDDDDPDDDLDI